VISLTEPRIAVCSTLTGREWISAESYVAYLTRHTDENMRPRNSIEHGNTERVIQNLACNIEIIGTSIFMIARPYAQMYFFFQRRRLQMTAARPCR